VSDVVRGDLERLLDMIEMCDLLLRHASDPAELATDPVVQGAAQRWIEILGEAAGHVSEGVRRAHPDVPWREITGIRIILAHGYFHIDSDIVGTVITNEIPRLRRRLGEIASGIDS
jgi:uncharacterized protein with HEPN domain